MSACTNNKWIKITLNKQIKERITINFIYKFINSSDEIIYIGKTNNLTRRIQHHSHLPEEAYEELYEIHYTTMNTVSDQHIMEIALINYYKPIYNQQDKKDDDLTILKNEINKLKWEKYDEYEEVVNLTKNYNKITLCHKKISNNFFKDKHTAMELSALGLLWYMIAKANSDNELLVAGKPITNKQISKETKIGTGALTRYLSILSDLGYIEIKGASRSRRIFLSTDFFPIE